MSRIHALTAFFLSYCCIFLTASGSTLSYEIYNQDIDDLQKEMAHTQRADIKRVYDNLTRGSRNHLRSFDRTLRQMGQTYTPEFISQAQYDAIASSAQEKAYGQGGGQGCRQESTQGRGRQNAQGRNQTQRMPQCIN